MISKIQSRENRVRAIARRRGLHLTKGRGAGYLIVDRRSASVVLTGTTGLYSLLLEEVETFLTSADPGQLSR